MHASFIKPISKICLKFPAWRVGTCHIYTTLYSLVSVVFSFETLINVIKRINPKPRFGKLSVLEHVQKLICITFKEFWDIIRKFDFRVISSPADDKK